MKKYLFTLFLILIPVSLFASPLTNNWLVWNGSNWLNKSTTTLGIVTNISSTTPTAGQVLVGQANGTYAPQATSTLGTISGLQDLLGGLNAILGNATTTNLTISSLANTVLAVNGSGKVIATTTSAGGVTNVTGTYPVVSSGGNTPALSLAFGTTTSNTWAGTQTFGVIKTATTSAFCAFDTTGRLIATTTPTGGSGTPAGSNNQIQFNNNGVFGGAGISWDGAKVVAPAGSLIIAPNSSNDSSYGFRLGLNTDYSTLDGATFWSDGGDPVFSVDAVNAGLIVGKTYASSDPSLTSPTNGMVVQGKVGIGTSTPATTLDVYGTTTTRNLIVNDGSTTGTTTVAIGNPKIGKTCYWNGTNWTMLWFANNSITPVYATSSVCQ